MQPKEKLFREIIKLDDEIKEKKKRIKELEARAVKLGWGEISDSYEAQIAPSKTWWIENQPELYNQMIKFYVTTTKKGRFTDKGYKNQLAKAIAAGIV